MTTTVFARFPRVYCYLLVCVVGTKLLKSMISFNHVCGLSHFEKQI